MMTAELVIPSSADAHLRRLDIRRDLEAVADLVEMCFIDTLDPDGKGYLRSMRESARNARLIGWTSSFHDQSPNPLTGLVWEEDGRLVGNLSLIPISVLGRRCYLIANVAVHPEYRGRGIGRTLAIAALDFARGRRLPAIWLQVREDNPAAVQIYNMLSFKERVRRTTWHSTSDIPALSPTLGLVVGARRSVYWAQQRQWLELQYPAEFAWHLPLDWSAMRPDLLGIVYRFFSFEYPRHWAVQRAGQLQAVLTWQHSAGFSDSLWLAAPSAPDEEAIRALLVYARKHISRRHPLSMNLPAGQAAQALRDAGFSPHQTLIWMEYKFD